MSNPSEPGALSADETSRLVQIGNILIPAYADLPRLEDAPIIERTIQRVLNYRPDLKDDVRRGLAVSTDMTPIDAARRLHDQDRAALRTIGLVLSAAYLMTPDVRKSIGYPGQERIEREQNDVTEIPTREMLAGVIARGTICRLTH